MRASSHLRPRAKGQALLCMWRPQLELLEDRLPPGDVLGALLSGPLLGFGSAPSGPPAAEGLSSAGLSANDQATPAAPALLREAADVTPLPVPTSPAGAAVQAGPLGGARGQTPSAPVATAAAGLARTSGFAGGLADDGLDDWLASFRTATTAPPPRESSGGPVGAGGGAAQPAPAASTVPGRTGALAAPVNSAPASPQSSPSVSGGASGSSTVSAQPPSSGRAQALSLSNRLDVHGLTLQTAARRQDPPPPGDRSSALAPVSGADSGNGIVVDAQGNSYVVGTLNNTTTLGDDVFVAKFDAQCNLVCLVTLPNAGPDSGNAIALTNEVTGLPVLYVTGSMFDTATGHPDLFVAKLDTSCHLICSTIVPDTAGPSVGNGIITNAAGTAAFVTGAFSNGVNSNVFVATFDSQCHLTCMATAARPGPDSGNGVALTPQGLAYVTGTVTTPAGNELFVAQVDFSCHLVCATFLTSPNPVPAVGNAISVDAQGYAFVTGYATSPVTGNDVLLARFDPQCNLVCVVTAPHPGPDSGNGIAVTPLGDAFMTGQFQGGAPNPNYFVGLVTPQCTKLCATVVPNVGPDSGNAVAADRTDQAHVTGTFFTAAGPKIFVAIYGPQCNLVCMNVLTSY